MDVSRPSTRVAPPARPVRPARLVRRVATACAVVLVALGCSSSDGEGTATTARASDPATSSTAAPSSEAPTPAESLLDSICTGAPRITDSGTITSSAITEASGLVASRTHPGVWWVHNDSGDAPTIYAIDDRGELLDTVALAGATARDWEDIAIGPGAGPDDPEVLYVGDIGDNAMLKDDVDAARKSLVVYRLDEPEVDPAAAAGTARPAVAVDALTFVYPDGPHDAEAMLVDPIDGDLLLVTKDWARLTESQVYRAPAGLADGSTTTLEHVGSVTLDPGTLVTGADVSPDGSLVALRSYGAVDVYARPAGEPLWAAFDQTPCAGPVPTETQGEAIGFAADGGSYLTVSEGEQPVLHRTTP